MITLEDGSVLTTEAGEAITVEGYEPGGALPVAGSPVIFQGY